MGTPTLRCADPVGLRCAVFTASKPDYRLEVWITTGSIA